MARRTRPGEGGGKGQHVGNPAGVEPGAGGRAWKPGWAPTMVLLTYFFLFLLRERRKEDTDKWVTDFFT
jgi:hypothetical protein